MAGPLLGSHRLKKRRPFVPPVFTAAGANQSTMKWDGPVLDNHLHLGGNLDRALDAVNDFSGAGGTHMLVVNKPSWWYGVEVSERADFRHAYDTTVEVVETVSEQLPGRAWPILGVHPALLTRLVDERDMSVSRTTSLMQDGIDLAAEYVADGRALAIKSGRPHYPLDDALWEASNRVMRFAFERAGEVNCAVQLHTETGEDFEAIARWAERAGLPRERVVKHYAGGRIVGPTPSVIAKKEALTNAIAGNEPFLMETDFLDDPERPGAVLGPKTVPRRVKWFADQGHEDAIRRAHRETPRRVYGIELEDPADA